MARFRFFAAAATTGLKGREKMIVVNPQTVTNRELAALAMQAKGRISRLYLHWTAGHYEDVYDDYHLNIGPGGEMYLTCKTFTEVKEPGTVIRAVSASRCAALPRRRPAAAGILILEASRRQ